jgi:ABC-2 type transport system permease protein
VRDSQVATLAMLRLAWRRDRIVLSAWVVGLAVMSGFSAAATADLYPTEASRIEAAETLNASAAIVALYGRVYDATSLGAVSMIKLTAFGAAIVGILMLFVAIRHTRAEEEPGRLELLSGGRLGRAAPLTATVILTAGACVVLAVLTTLANTAAGLPFQGSLAFGLGWAATGLVYAAVGVVVAQLTTSARAARGLGLVVIAVTYGLRAIGDLAEPGPSALSWLSPIGWNQQIRAYAGDRWWVLLLPLATTVVLVWVAYALRARRDLGAGLREDRPGPATGSLSGVGGLAWRLQSRILLAWAVAFVVFSLLLGSMASSVTDLLTSDAMREFFEKLGGTAALVDTFLGAEIAILGAIAAAYGLSAADRLRSEEVEGHTDQLLATSTTRARWATSHYAIALLGVTGLMLLTGVSLGTAAALSLGDSTYVGRIVLVALGQVPAAWVVTSLVLLFFGWAPRFTVAVWGLLVVFVALGEFGALWNTPQWLMDLSPLQHSPTMPVGAEAVLPLVVLTLVAAVISGLGYLGWLRRDTPH